jgi:2-dehydropantoate 2-reductase
MKIAVVGCGAVGSYYGARLAAAGQETHFLLRSDFEAVSANGVSVQSPLGDFNVRVACAKTPSKIGPCDLALVALKTTANDQIESLLAPLLKPDTVVVTLQNGLGNEEWLARRVRPENVMGGLCFVCLNRIAPGVILHLAHGQVVLGDFVPRDESRRERLAEVFQAAGVPCAPAPNLASARWEKLVWNIPFNGLGVASAAGVEALAAGAASRGAIQPCLTTDALIQMPDWEKLVRGLMIEVISAARKQGFPLKPELVEEKMGLTRDMGPYKPSTLLDYERGQPLELDSMFFEPLRRAKAAGADVPLMSRLCGVLRDLDGRGKGAGVQGPDSKGNSCPNAGHSAREGDR